MMEGSVQFLFDSAAADREIGALFGLIFMAGLFSALGLRLLYLSGAHLLPLWAIVHIWHVAKRLYRRSAAAGAAGPAGIPTKTVEEIFEKYGQKK